MERRSSKRTSQCLPAKVFFNDVFLCDCVIKNMSFGGMRLYVPPGAWLPGEFTVHSVQMGQPLRVRTVWTNRENVGVQIVANPVGARSEAAELAGEAAFYHRLARHVRPGNA